MIQTIQNLIHGHELWLLGCAGVIGSALLTAAVIIWQATPTEKKDAN